MLSSDDPVRVFQDFATLDLLSGGRAEIMAGRGSFVESFPLFGYDLGLYDELFAEKLELLLALRDVGARDLVGAAPGADRRPRRLPAPAAGPAAGVGRGRRQSRVGGSRGRCSGCRWRSRSSAACPSGSRRSPSCTGVPRSRPGHDPLPALSINSHGYIADTSQQALDESYPAVSAQMNRIGRERGWPPMARADYDAAATLRGANFVGSPQQVIEKILFQHEIFGHDRCLLQFSVGTMPHDKIMRSIELFGTEVAPAVRRELAVPSRAHRSHVVRTARTARGNCRCQAPGFDLPERCQSVGRTAGARHRGSNCNKPAPKSVNFCGGEWD